MLPLDAPELVEDAAVDQQSTPPEQAVMRAPTPMFYANASSSLGGAFDVRIEFAYQRGNEPPEWVAAVIMSWEHTQALADSLNRMLRDFQEKAGPLPDVSNAGAASLEGTNDD